MSHLFQAIGVQRDRLGESPVWSATEQALYWVDIRNRMVRRHDHRTGSVKTWETPSVPGSIGLIGDGRLLVAHKSSIDLFDPTTGSFEKVSDPAFADPNLRFNDGRIDRQGRFWVGSMNDVTRAPVGHLYRLGMDFRLAPVLGGIRCPNSLCWSPDSSMMYFADSDLRTIFEYAFDKATGEVGPPRPLVQVDGPAVPDGCAVDSEGYLWCALYGGGRVMRYSPDGKEDRVVETPVSQPTSCAFGGPDLRILYVTTAYQRLTDDQLAHEPLAGTLLALPVDVAGLPEPTFALNA